MSEFVQLPDDVHILTAIDADEKILWRGHPSTNYRMRTAVLWRLPNALFFLGVALFSCFSAIYFQTFDITLQGNNILIRLIIFAFSLVLLLLGYKQLRNIVLSFRTPQVIRYYITKRKVVIDESATLGELRIWPIDKVVHPEFRYFADGTCDVTLIEEWVNDGDGAGIEKCIFFAVQDSEGLKQALNGTRAL